MQFRIIPWVSKPSTWADAAQGARRSSKTPVCRRTGRRGGIVAGKSF